MNRPSELVVSGRRKVVRTKKRQTAYMAICLVLGLVALSACGSSSKAKANAGSPGSSSSVSSTGSSAQATGTPILVGMICDCSGADSSVTSLTKGYEAFVGARNASGGIGGHPVKLSIEDTGSNPGAAVSAYQKLASQHVVAIVDDTNFDNGFAAMAQAANIPIIGGLASNLAMFENPDFYPAAQTEDSATYAVVKTAKTAGATNIGVLYCAEAPVCAQLVPLVKQEGQKLGVASVFSAAVAETAPNYTALCLGAEQAHVSTLAVFTRGDVLSHVSKSCAQQGYNPTYISEGQGMTPSLLSAGVQKLYSEYEVFPYWAKSAGTDEMNAAVNKYEPGVLSDPNVWNQEGVEGWTAGLLLEQAVKAAGLSASQDVTSADLIKGLQTLHQVTLGGMAPPLTFPAGKGHPVDCWFTGQDLNSKPSLLNNGQTSCMSSSGS